MKPDYLDSEIDSSIFLSNTCMFFRQVKFLSILGGDITVAPRHNAWDTSEYKFNEDIIQRIVEHETGHALGLGHANFDGNLMAEKVNDGTEKVSE